MAFKWSFIETGKGLGNAEDQWRALWKEKARCHPLLHPEFVSPLIKNFANPKVVLATARNAHTAAVVALQQRKVGIWESFAPGPSPICLAIAECDPRGSSAGLIQSLLASLPGYAIQIGFNRLDPDHELVAVPAIDHAAERVDYITTLRVPIEGTFEAYWQARSRNLKRDIQKKFKRIEAAAIKLELKELRNKNEIPGGVETYGNIESQGWKGDIGTAVHISNARGQFYADMLEMFAERDCASIYQLLFNGRVAASSLAIRGAGMAVLLKTTYDQQLSQFSPGWIMMHEIHRRIFASGEARVIEYYGNSSPKLKEWAHDVRTMYHLNYYRSPFLKLIRNASRRITSLPKI